jgi:beta-glucosidase
MIFESQKRRIVEMKGQCDLIFIGDSITEGWDRALWAKYYGARHALNYGVGGDTTQNVLARLQYPGLKTLKPRVAVILIGTNNTRNTPEDIDAGVQAVVDATKADFPGIKVILLDILPTARETDRMAAANQLISNISDEKSVFRLDLSPKMPKEGDNWKGLLPDRLHLTKEGYQIWAENMEPLLSKLLGDTTAQ